MKKMIIVLFISLIYSGVAAAVDIEVMATHLTVKTNDSVTFKGVRTGGSRCNLPDDQIEYYFASNFPGGTLREYRYFQKALLFPAFFQNRKMRITIDGDCVGERIKVIRLTLLK